MLNVQATSKPQRAPVDKAREVRQFDSSKLTSEEIVELSELVTRYLLGQPGGAQ